MKTVLVISVSPTHQLMYEKGLVKYFIVECDPSKVVDAVVFDLASTNKEDGLKWVENLEVPTVILTPEDSLPLPKRANRCVLTYPVTMDKLLKALARVGVEADEPRASPPRRRSR